MCMTDNSTKLHNIMKELSFIFFLCPWWTCGLSSLFVSFSLFFSIWKGFYSFLIYERTFPAFPDILFHFSTLILNFSLLIDKSKLSANHLLPQKLLFLELSGNPLALVWLALLDYRLWTFGWRTEFLLFKMKMVSITSTKRGTWPTRDLFSFEWTLFTCKSGFSSRMKNSKQICHCCSIHWWGLEG
jgi:hypothetical protein